MKPSEPADDSDGLVGEMSARSASVFEGQLRKEFQARTRHDLHNLAAAPMPESAKLLLLRMSFFMQKAVHNVQPYINKKGIGFKGFIPATFATQVAERFSKDTGLKLRQIGPPGAEPRNPNNKPDEQEELLLYAVLMYPWQCGRCRRCFHRFQR